MKKNQTKAINWKRTKAISLVKLNSIKGGIHTSSADSTGICVIDNIDK